MHKVRRKAVRYAETSDLNTSDDNSRKRRGPSLFMLEEFPSSKRPCTSVRSQPVPQATFQPLQVPPAPTEMTEPRHLRPNSEITFTPCSPVRHACSTPRSPPARRPSTPRSPPARRPSTLHRECACDQSAMLKKIADSQERLEGKLNILYAV